jgi:hypothetical protein
MLVSRLFVCHDAQQEDEEVAGGTCSSVGDDESCQAPPPEREILVQVDWGESNLTRKRQTFGPSLDK